MMKVLVGALAVVILGLGAVFVMWDQKAPGSEDVMNGDTDTTMTEGEKSVVAPGTYQVDPAVSTFDWSAKKPLIDGYVNSGTISVKDGSVTVTDTEATGMFTLDMTTIHVGLTATKPGKEGALETHLKTADFFDVEKFPTAEFKLTSVTANPDSATTFMYNVTGDLTMKGKTNSVSFPAEIYWQNDMFNVKAQFEIDRTKWDITYGSGNFFKNVGDNMIADQVAIAIHVMGKKVQ